MRNLYFDPAALKGLLTPERWRLVCSWLAPEAPVLRNDRFRAWRRVHVDRHPQQEILIPLAGNTGYGFFGHPYVCVPGTVFFFDRFEPHDAGYPGGHADHLWISILGDRTVAWRLLIGRRPSPRRDMNVILQPSDLGADMQHLFSAARKAAVVSRDLSRTRVLSAVSLILTAVVEKGYAPIKKGDQPRHHDIIETLGRHVMETGGAGANLDNLARLSGYSKFHFHRLFRRHMGKSVHTFVNACRSERAAILRREGRSQKEIGAALGFSCASAFSRWWRGQKRHSG
jgi:AraC-like DNA-binding protein